MTEALYAELDRIFADRDRADMAPTIAALRSVYAQHADDARVLYELGGAYDTAGDEATAVDFYRRALGAGLDGDVRRRCLLQYGSTLRNLDRFDDSLDVFALARREFPESIALRVFEAISLHAAGRVNASLGALLDIVADHVDAAELERYKPAVRGNADHLRGLDADA